MEITTSQVLKILYIISWIIFVGLCIEAGAFIFSAVFIAAVHPVEPGFFYTDIDLSALYKYDRGHFFVQVFFMCVTAVMRAIIFYLIIKILHDKKLDMVQPFNKHVQRFIANVSYLSFGTGMFSIWGMRYAEWLVKQGAEIPGATFLRFGGGDVWLFMGVTLYVIAQIFKKGIEIQTENELTI